MAADPHRTRGIVTVGARRATAASRRTAAVLSAVLAISAAVLAGASPAVASPVRAEAGPGFVDVDVPARADIRDHRVTIALLAPQGSEPSFAADEARRSLELVDEFYDRETNGAIRFELEQLLDWQSVDQPIGCSDTAGLHQWLRERIGWQGGAARHLVIMVPPGDPCPTWANGEQPGDPDDGGGTFQPGPDPYLLAHELGHNLSLAHASSIRCDTSWDYPAGVECPRDEYGNRTDMMGGAWSFLPLSSPTLARLGVLPNVREPVCGDARTAVLDSLGAGTPASRTLTWTDPENPDARYWVQYSDASDPVSGDGAWPSPWQAERTVSGVQILRSNPAQPYGGDLLERPGDTTEANEFVTAGETVALNSGMTVRVDEIDEIAHRATVTVTVPCADPTTVRDITGSAVATASYVPEWSSAAAAVDGDPGSVWSSWPRVGEQWLELTWGGPVTVERVSVALARDAADDEARGLIPPRAWRVERWDAATGRWLAVAGATFTPSRDESPGEVAFQRVTTSAIRLVFDAWGEAEYTGSTGVADIAVFGGTAPPVVDPEPPVVEPEPPVMVDPEPPVVVDPEPPVVVETPVDVPGGSVVPGGSSAGTDRGAASGVRSLAETGGAAPSVGIAVAALLTVLAGGGAMLARRRTPLRPRVRTTSPPHLAD